MHVPPLRAMVGIGVGIRGTGNDEALIGEVCL
jgi:hypothetical protein